MADQGILGADLLLRLGIDASGISTELSSKMTAVERQAVAQGDKISDAYGKANDKVVASQLRVISAQERVNKLMASEKATLGQRATAASGLIAAQQRYNTELSKTATHKTAIEKSEKSRFGGLASGLAAGAGIAGTQGILSIISQAKDAAVEYQDVVAANDVTFGKQRSQLDRFKRLQADQFNLSQLQAEQSANLFGQVFKGAGSSQKQALQQGLELTKRAADVRSFRGGTLSDVQGAFRSALVGETEPIRRYGVLLDDARLRLRAFDLGLVDSTKGTLPPAIKAQAAYAEILAQTSDAQGDITRTADSAANKLEDARQKADDAKRTLGDGLLPVITELATAGSELAPALSKVAGALGAVLGNDIARRSLEIGAAAAAVSKLGGALNNFVNRTQEKIAGNVALAGSYDRVAVSAGRAAGAEVAASRAGGGAVAGGGRFSGGRGQLVGLGALGLAAGAAGATGGGFGHDAANVLSDAATGAGIGSFFPGPGTAIGAVAGALGGVALNILGPSGPGRTTNRTPAQVKRDLADVNAQLRELQRTGNRTNVDDPAKLVGLQQRRSSLTEELKAAQDQATKTFDVVDQGTGKVQKLTQAQIAAAGAAGEHAKQLANEQKAFADLVDSFRVEPFSGAPDTKKALGGKALLGRARGAADFALQQRRDFAKIAARGASREELDALRGAEASSPGTIHRVAQQTGRSFLRELRTELRRQSRNANLLAHIFDDAPDQAEKDARKAARRAHRALWDEWNQLFRENPLTFAVPTPGNVPFVVNSSAIARRRRQP